MKPLRLGTWHHVVGVWQQGGFSYLYVNGVQRGVASSATHNAACHKPLWIGHTAPADGDDLAPAVASGNSTIGTAATGSSPGSSSSTDIITISGGSGSGSIGSANDTAEVERMMFGGEPNKATTRRDFGSGVEGYIGLVRVYARVRRQPLSLSDACGAVDHTCVCLCVCLSVCLCLCPYPRVRMHGCVQRSATPALQAAAPGHQMCARVEKCVQTILSPTTGHEATPDWCVFSATSNVTSPPPATATTTTRTRTTTHPQALGAAEVHTLYARGEARFSTVAAAAVAAQV